MKTLQLVTHAGAFHPDDIFSTALLAVYFKRKDKTIKLKYKRSYKTEDIAAADIVYDIGFIHNPKKLRFDHHQNDEKLTRPNGIKYAAFGLLFKHFGMELIQLVSGEKSKKVRKEIYDIIEKKLVFHIDAIDNGQLTYKQLIKGADVFTVDNYFIMTRNTIDTGNAKETDKKFFELAKFAETILEHVIAYAINVQKESTFAIKAYKKAKDKRVIVCERFYNYNFNKFPEPLLVVYPDLRGGWSAKNVQAGEDLYDGRFFFPKEWGGLAGKDLEEVTGIEGSNFCHKSGFLISHKTFEGLMKMIDLAFSEVL